MELPTDDIARFEDELGLKRLNDVQSLLWLAGRPTPPRPLHYQLVASRDIFISEKMDMHLLWQTNRIYLKPIPRYLLDYQFWNKILICESTANCVCNASATSMSPNPAQHQSCGRRLLYRNSLGFLLSYVALVQYESDFEIAKAKGLVPDNLMWKNWKALVRQLLDQKNRSNVNERFQFGELRLTRLNLIYRLRFAMFRGYKFRFQDSSEYFQYSLTPIVSFITYIAIVLTAMQVGLATDRLGQNKAFQNASYGFTVFSILGPLILVSLAAFGFLIIMLNSLREALRFKKHRFAQYQKLYNGA